MKKFQAIFKRISLKLFVLHTILLITVFTIIIFININFFTNQIESNIRDHAIQFSNLIKRSVRNSMLKNHREDLAHILADIGKEHYIENIRIFKKIGQIAVSTDSSEIGMTFDKSADLCIFCHIDKQPKGIIPKENQFREITSHKSDHLLGLVNPIENEPDCYNSACHAHSSDETLLGYLDITISLKDLETNASNTRNTTLAFSIVLIILATITIGKIIQNQVQQPISKLILGTRQLADLNLDYAIDIHSSDEIGDLAKSFNNMTERLKSANNKLKEWSTTLEHKVAEKTEELEKAQHHLILSEKMASMGRLSAVVAHELNNPMSAILTYSTLLIKNLKDRQDQETIDDAIENLLIIRDESRRCGEIVNNLGHFSKPSFGEKSNSDLLIILNKVIALVRHSIEIRNMQLVTDLTQEDTVMFCDPFAIEQMLIALFVNAVEASRSNNGQILMKLYRNDEKKNFCLEITDNGTGILEEVLPHIFEPYYSTKETNKNSGLGLMVVYGIVDSHGGSINVRSIENEETTFIINLPINSEVS